VLVIPIGRARNSYRSVTNAFLGRYYPLVTCREAPLLQAIEWRGSTWGLRGVRKKPTSKLTPRG
jgi:hypothetical protein